MDYGIRIKAKGSAGAREEANPSASAEKASVMDYGIRSRTKGSAGAGRETNLSINTKTAAVMDYSIRIKAKGVKKQIIYITRYNK